MIKEKRVIRVLKRTKKVFRGIGKTVRAAALAATVIKAGRWVSSLSKKSPGNKKPMQKKAKKAK